MAGNSSFGKKQSSATTRTTGSANNAYGKAKAASKKPSPSMRRGKSTRTDSRVRTMKKK